MGVIPPPDNARPCHDHLGGANPTVINGCPGTHISHQWVSWHTYNIRAEADAAGGHQYACLIWMELRHVLPVILIYDYTQEGMQHMARWLCVCLRCPMSRLLVSAADQSYEIELGVAPLHFVSAVPSVRDLGGMWKPESPSHELRQPTCELEKGTRTLSVPLSPALPMSWPL